MWKSLSQLVDVSRAHRSTLDDAYLQKGLFGRRREAANSGWIGSAVWIGDN